MKEEEEEEKNGKEEEEGTYICNYTWHVMIDR